MNVFVVHYIDFYNNRQLIGVFDSEAKAWEGISSVYEAEETEMPKNISLEESLMLCEDNFEIEVDHVELNDIMLNY